MAESPPVIVTWNDAWADVGSHAVESVRTTPAVTRTCGFLIKSTEAGVLLSTELWPEWEPDHISCPTFIPRLMIIEIEYLGVLT